MPSRRAQTMHITVSCQLILSCDYRVSNAEGRNGPTGGASRKASPIRPPVVRTCDRIATNKATQLIAWEMNARCMTQP